MRRRWEWPIIGAVKGMDADARFSLVAVWLILGMFVFIGALLASTSGPRNEVRFDWSHPALYVLILWLGPIVLALLVSLARLMPSAFMQLVPRRVTTPVREDLRTVSRR